jgi:hypothetical protein
MRSIILLLFLACGVKGYAQQFPNEGSDSLKLARSISDQDYRHDTLKTLFTFNWQQADQANAFYFTEVFPVSDHWCALDYYTQNSSLASKGFFKDRELKMADGPIIDFYPKGGKARLGYYQEGKKMGWWILYSDSGQITDSTFYVLGIPVGSAVSRYPTGEIASISQRDSSGSGPATGYFKSGSVSYSGTYIHGYEKDSLWRHFYPDGKPAYEALFDKGNLVSEQCFDRLGHIQKECIKEKMAEFPGGERKLGKYLSNHIHFPHYQASGQILVRFSVDTSGEIDDIEVIKQLPMVYGYQVISAFNEAVISAVRNMPDWEPGIAFNQKVKVYYTLPVTFAFK